MGAPPGPTLVRNTQNTDTSYRHTGLSGGVTRHYRVSAINFNGTGDPSDVAHATTEEVLPDAPLRLTARARGTSEIVLNWSAPTSSGSSRITGYWIQRCSSTRRDGLPADDSLGHRRVDHARGRHRITGHLIHPPRPQARHHPPLPRRGQEPGGLERVVEHRSGDHRTGRSGRTHEAHGDTLAPGGKHPARPRLVGSVRRRRKRDHRLPDRVVRHPRGPVGPARNRHRISGQVIHRQRS